MRFNIYSAFLLFIGAAMAARLVDFQVAQPLYFPQDIKQCTVKVLE
jgi:hypothetical protein